MKVFISVDIEGVTGVTSWKETEKGNGEYDRAAVQMKKEALAACQGALDAGADEIWVKDSHDTGRNLWIDEFPEQVRLIRGWMYTPDSMVAGVDGSFDAALCIGYHSAGGTGGNPLSHTMTSDGLFWTKLNGEYMSELMLHTLVCAGYGVPMIFVSGDEELCDTSKEQIPGLLTVPTKKGIGGATINRNPQVVCREIRETVKRALGMDHTLINTNRDFRLEVCYRQHPDALKASHYPGAKLEDPFTVSFETDCLRDLLTAFYLIH